MSDVTLEAIEHLLDSKLEEKLEEKLGPIKATLAQHTGQLEQLITERKVRDENKAVETFRVDRLEIWAQKAGDTIWVKIDL